MLIDNWGAYMHRIYVYHKLWLQQGHLMNIRKRNEPSCYHIRLLGTVMWLAEQLTFVLTIDRYLITGVCMRLKLQTISEETIQLCRWRSVYSQLNCTHTLRLTALTKLLQTTV